jgi:hypothetical protein
MFDISDLFGKYKIVISATHKELLEYVKDFPNLVYLTDKKRFVIASRVALCDIQIKNFPFTYKDVTCYISIIAETIGKCNEIKGCYIHGDDINILKEFAILVDDEDDRPPGLYT